MGTTTTHEHRKLELHNQMEITAIRSDLNQYLHRHWWIVDLNHTFARNWNSGYCAKVLLEALGGHAEQELLEILNRLDKAEHPWEFDFSVTGNLPGLEDLKVGEDVIVMALGAMRVISVGSRAMGTEEIIAVQELTGMDGRLGPRIEVVPKNAIQQRGI